MQHFITRRHGIQIINRPDMHRLLFGPFGRESLRMKLYKKEGNILQIISFPTESAEKGDYLMVEDADAAKALIAQVIDVQFAAVPGVLEEFLRTLPDGGEPFKAKTLTLSKSRRTSPTSKTQACLSAKSAPHWKTARLVPAAVGFPAVRNPSSRKLSIPMLMKLAKVDGKLPIILGGTKDSSLLTIDASAIDGTLNIITGKKGCGKSHLCKLLMASLSATKQPLSFST